MKIIIVRHGDPDYQHDCLTGRGRREAELAAERLCRIPVKNYYVSPLGRARETAQYTLDRVGRSAEVMEWLHEFGPLTLRPDLDGRRTICWDWYPADWTSRPVFYDKDRWWQDPVMMEADVKSSYDWVTANLDRLLARHGLVRDGMNYRVTMETHDTIMMFCHFGVECVLLSHMLGISPMILWHGFLSLPTGVTTVYTEERTKGTASLRVTGFGDTSHLAGSGLEDSTRGQYRECGSDPA